MKKYMKIILCLIVITGLVFPSTAYATQGDCGYEGGISSQVFSGKTTTGKASYNYSEVCFITGKPLVFTGTVTISKSSKQSNTISTYVYSLTNTEKKATLTRTVVYNTKITKKDNGQTIEETSFSKTPTEVVKFDKTSYVLKSYTFTKTNIIDPKPAVNYFAGNLWGKKVYQVGSSPAKATLQVETTGNFYGYDQYWSNAEVQTLDYLVNYESTSGDDNWTGTASVTVSSNSSKQVKYEENEPDQISFDGGYVQTQQNDTVLDYSCSMPEFDSKGISTDNIINSKDNLKLEMFPSQSRLPVTDLNYLRGNWAEDDIKVLFGLEVFKSANGKFDPQKFITRAEFASALMNAIKDIPTDPSIKTTATKKSSKTKLTSPFNDVSVDSIYFNDINNAYKRGIFSGRGDKCFAPDDTITVAEAVYTFIKALGLQNMAPGSSTVTTFKDNDSIPSFARSSMYVAQEIGLVQADDRGYINSNSKITKGKAAVMLNSLIEYMRNGIIRDYRQNIINY
jgi:hypothetical protein